MTEFMFMFGHHVTRGLKHNKVLLMHWLSQNLEKNQIEGMLGNNNDQYFFKKIKWYASKHELKSSIKL